MRFQDDSDPLSDLDMPVVTLMIDENDDLVVRYDGVSRYLVTAMLDIAHHLFLEGYERGGPREPD